ncbi:MAG: hypothetical protein NZ928_02280 [Endomicrobia bacterium]|nr:hypothetical protein [Endomicrobiia bacterium]
MLSKTKKLTVVIIFLWFSSTKFLTADFVDSMESLFLWTASAEEMNKPQGSKIKIFLDKGIKDNAIKIVFELGNKGRWAQIEKSFYKDISEYNSIKFFLRGGGEPANLQFKIEDMDGTVYGKTFSDITSLSNWKEIKLLYSDLEYFWGGSDKNLDTANIKKVYFAVTGLRSQKGYVLIDDLTFFKSPPKVKLPKVPQEKFYTVKKNPSIAKKAAQWIKKQQKDTGLVASFENEEPAYAWTYDQALALLVFAHEDKTAAKKLLAVFAKLQNPDGSWYDGYISTSCEPATDNLWIGSVAWMSFAIAKYSRITNDVEYLPVAKKACEWLKSKMHEDGSIHDSTEGNLDCWWAFFYNGYHTEAERVKNFILSNLWNETEKRFNTGRNNPEVYLDPQTWGAEFLKAIGEEEKARWALSFAEENLKCTTFDDRIVGFDTSGPFTVWNEGTLQYVCAGGRNAQFYLDNINRQQREDGALQHSHERFHQGGIWHTTMYGVAPTAWLYFAHTESPLRK